MAAAFGFKRFAIISMVALGGYPLALIPSLHAQGVLTLTPGTTVSTTAGNGIIGYSGDGGAATAATLASPSAVAYDAAGNLYFADALNHVVREITKTGTIITVAGNGFEGFSGDGGAATSAQLDTPTGVAIDVSGNLYIADSRNHRIREVSAGTITTIAGTGNASFSGDGGAASAATFAVPSAVTLDSSGNLYIADTDNNRIRRISTAGTITTVAGTGEQLFSGDGSAATSATLDGPTGVAVDASGNLYIVDRHNQRIRRVDLSGKITTVAGSGPASFSGSFAGDGGAAIAASLALPSGIAADSTGNLYIADTGNQRIRQFSPAASIVTVAGSGGQGFAGDGGIATSAEFDSPRSIAFDAAGNLSIADRANQRLRALVLPTLTFAAEAVGVPSAAQTITLANTGTGSLVISGIAVSAITPSGSFPLTAGGTCTAPPLTLAAGASCTQNIAFFPTAPGAASGSIVVTAAGDSESILLAGTGSKSASTMTLAGSATSVYVGVPITFTASVAPVNSVPATGLVTFYNGTTSIGSQSISANQAALTTTFAAPGARSITAVYAGDANYASSASSALVATIVADPDFNFNIAPTSPGGTAQTVVPGQTAIFDFILAPQNSAFNAPITLSVSGLPLGATAALTPGTITPGAAGASFQLAVKTAAITALLHRISPSYPGVMAALAVLLLPGLRRRKEFLHGPRVHGVRMLFLCGIALALSGLALSGCGVSTGFFAQQPHSYTITVTGTATGVTGATLQHSTTVTLTVQ